MFKCTVLSEFLVTTTWRVHRLRMEETASRNEGQLRIYYVSSRVQPTRGDPSDGGLSWDYQLLAVKIKLVTKCHKGPWTSADNLDKQSKLRKMDMRFGTWNIRSLYRAGTLMTTAKWIPKYKLDLVGVHEVRWDGGGTEPAGEYTFLYGKGNENNDLGTVFLNIKESYQQSRG
jgi:hypothetical protein